uniref:Recombinase zinc beta ribbon domain-containing protein n=1 Tax=Panagrolaimus sp. ES5 TaxID=591445 RepID=A0AC34FLD5_9BILA
MAPIPALLARKNGEIVPLNIKNKLAYCRGCENLTSNKKSKGKKPIKGRKFNDEHEFEADPTSGHHKECKFISVDQKLEEQFKNNLFQVIKDRKLEFKTKDEVLAFYLAEVEAINMELSGEQIENLRNNLWSMIKPVEEVFRPNTRSEQNEILPGK